MFGQYFLPWLWCQAFLFAESPYLLSPLGTVLSLQTWTMALHFNFRCKMREKARSWFISRLFHYFSCRSGCVSTLLSILCSWFWVGQVTSIKPTKTFSGKKTRMWKLCGKPHWPTKSGRSDIPEIYSLFLGSLGQKYLVYVWHGSNSRAHWPFASKQFSPYFDSFHIVARQYYLE